MKFKKFCRKYKLNRSKVFNFFLIDLFLALAIIAIYPFWKTGYLYSGLDMQFHLSRIQEWAQDIQQGGLFSHPIIATHTFNEMGDVVPSMYPWVTLFPFVLFMLFMKPVSAVYAGFTLIVFITLLLAYCSMYVMTHSRHLSFYFAILYGYTTYVVDQVLSFETGTALAYQFLPVAFAGLYMIMRKNYKKWYWLTLGLTGIMYSHALSSVLFIFFFALIYVSYFIKQPYHERWLRFKYLFLSGLITFFLTVSVWYPIVHVMISQKLSTPNAINLNGGSGDVYSILTTPFKNGGFNDGIGLFIIIITVLGFLLLRKTPKYTHKYYYFGLISLAMLSNLFPWGAISSTKFLSGIDIIQKTSRLYPICILLLAMYGAYVVNALCQFKRINYTAINVVLVVLSILFVSNFNEGGLYTSKPQPDTKEQTLPYQANFNHQVPLISSGGYRINNQMYNNQFPEENETGMEDYIPQSASNANFGDIALRGATLNHQHFYINQQDVHPGPNKMTYHLGMPMSKHTSLTLPFLKYNALKYRVMFNGKHVLSHQSKKGTLKIYVPYHAKSGANVSITSHQPNQIYLTLITLFTWVGVLFLLFKRHRSFRKE